MKKNITILKIAQIPSDCFSQAFLDSIDGIEEFVGTREPDDIIILVDALNQILEDPEDDTNDQVRQEIQSVYTQIYNYDYLMIIK